MTDGAPAEISPLVFPSPLVRMREEAQVSSERLKQQEKATARPAIGNRKRRYERAISLSTVRTGCTANGSCGASTFTDCLAWTV